MTVVCPRCATTNSSWDKRCRACWLPLGVASGANVERSTQSKPPNKEHVALAEKLEIDVAHAEALAKADIHTLEHVAESLPEKIEHALRAWSHIDAEKLIARARELLPHKPKLLDPETPDVPEKPIVKPAGADWWSDAN